MVGGMSPCRMASLTVLYIGPVVRVTPGMVSISDPKSIPTVYHRRADKSDFYTHGVLGERAPTVQILDHDKHAAKRKLIAPVVSLNIESPHCVTLTSIPAQPEKHNATRRQD